MPESLTKTTITYPGKTRELRTAVLDSRRWNAIRLRESDIVVATWAKSGTTWTVQIVRQIVGGAPDRVEGAAWPEAIIFPYDQMMVRLEAPAPHRFFKTHLPVDALGIDPQARYIYVGRDARDVVWSAFDHQAGLTQDMIDTFAQLPGRVGPPLSHPPGDARDSYLHFLEHGVVPGFPMGDFWSHAQSWWNVRALPNVLLVHFNRLKADMAHEIRRIAHFLGVHIDAATWPALLEHCGLDYMRARLATNESLKQTFKDGARTFFNRGTNGRWKDVLSAQEAARCDEEAAQHLTRACAHWLRTGELAE